MLVRYRHITDGPGPSEAIIEVNTTDGIEEIIVDRDILEDGVVNVGSVIAQRERAYLLELPRESTSGRTRVWISETDVVADTVAA